MDPVLGEEVHDTDHVDPAEGGLSVADDHFQRQSSYFHQGAFLGDLGQSFPFSSDLRTSDSLYKDFSWLGFDV